MKRAFAILALLLLPATVAADRSTLVAGGGTEAYPANPIAFQAFGGGRGTDWATGATIVADANVVSHATFPSGVISDTQFTWTTNGTPPAVTAGPFFPTGFGNAARGGAGPYSAANFYSLSGASVMNFAGNFMECIAFNPSTTSGTAWVLTSSGGGFNVSGYYVQLSASKLNFAENASGANAATGNTPNAMATNGPNIVCFGRSGTTLSISMNGGGEAVTATVSSYTAGTTAQLGEYTGDSTLFFPGIIYEEYATTTAYSAATAKQIELAYLGQTGTAGEQLAVTRATTATETAPTPNATTCATPPCVFTWPTGIGRVSNKGMTVEAASTNKVLQSEAQDNAAWTKGVTLTVTANTTVAPDNNTTADTDAGGAVAATNVSDSTGFLGSTSNWVGSIWVKAGSSQTWNLTIRDQAGAGSDLCTTADTATTTWRRVTVSCAGANNNDNIGLRVNPGANQTVIVWGAQLEQSGIATSYIATTSAAVTRNADSPVAPSPSSNAKNSGGSFFAKVLTESATLTSGQTVYFTSNGASGTFFLDTDATNWRCHYCDAAGTCNIASQAIAANPNTVVEKIACAWNTATNVSISVNSAAATTTAITGTAANAWADTSDFLGESAAATNVLAGFVSNVCVGWTTGACP